MPLSNHVSQKRNWYNFKVWLFIYYIYIINKFYRETEKTSQPLNIFWLLRFWNNLYLCFFAPLPWMLVFKNMYSFHHKKMSDHNTKFSFCSLNGAYLFKNKNNLVVFQLFCFKIDLSHNFLLLHLMFLLIVIVSKNTNI